MNAREFRHKVEFRAFRDDGVGAYDAKREFSDPVVCWAKVTPTSAKRLIDDVNSFGQERAVTHIIQTRWRDDLDVFSYVIWRGEWYKVFQRQESEDLKTISIGVIYERKANQAQLTRSVFDH